jgi:hypothetical protein
MGQLDGPQGQVSGNHSVKKLLFAAVLALPSLVAAEGTVSFQHDVMPILMQRPFFAKVLLDTFDFKDTVVATTIGREVSPTLALHRIGPYRVQARKKGEPGPGYDMIIVIDTTVHFLDKAGKEVQSPRNAVAIREEFDSIEIDPLPK